MPIPDSYFDIPQVSGKPKPEPETREQNLARLASTALPEDQAQELLNASGAHPYYAPQVETQPSRPFAPIPAAQAGYWDDPKRIVRYYNALQALPPGTQTPAWMDPQGITTAYKYMQLQNPGKPDYEWGPISADDPLRQMTQSWRLPSADQMDPDQDAVWIKKIMRPTVQLPGEEAAGTALPATAGVYGIDEDTWNRLPAWQRTLIPILSGVGSVAGKVTDTPVGSAVMGALNALDLPAEGLERIVGTGAQLAGSAIMPEWYGDLRSVIDNLPAAWQAAHLTYESAAAQIVGGNVPVLGQVENTQLAPEEYGLLAMKEARERLADIAAGRSQESVQNVLDDIGERYGLTGTLGDMVGHVVADPLNLIGIGETAALGKVAEKTGNKALATAAKLTKGEGLVSGIRAYGSILKTEIPIEEIGKMDKFSRWLAGVTVDAAGKPVWKLTQEIPENQTLVQKIVGLRHLTPQARATEIVDHTVNNLNHVLAGETDPERMLQYVNSLAKGTPSEVAQVSKVAQSVEGGVFPLALRESMPGVRELKTNLWDIPGQNREIVNNLASALEMDARKFVKEAADTKGADDLLTLLRQKLAQNGKEEALRGLEGMTGKDLSDIAKPFHTGAWALTPDDFRWKLIEKLATDTAAWTVKRFNVRPDPTWVRLSNTVKNAQSLVLLRLNPTFVLNNAINNIDTMAFQGVMSLDGAAKQEKFWSRLGLKPVRLRQGTVAMLEGEIGKGVTEASEAKSLIREAATQKGTLNSIDQAVKGVGDKVNWSERVERASSEIATYTGTRKAWGKLWKAGSGYDKMPTELEQTLSQLGIDPKWVYSHVDDSLNADEIRSKLWNEFGKTRANRVLSEDQQAVLRDSGVLDGLNERLANAKTDEDLRKAFLDTIDEANKNIDARLKSNLENISERTMARVKGEGMQAAVEEFDRIWGQWQDYWHAHFDNMADIYEQAGKMTPDKARAFKAQKFLESEQDWNRQWEYLNSKLVGVVRGLSGEAGKAGPVSERVINEMVTIQSGWKEYFTLRKNLNQLYNAAKYDNDAAALAQLRELLERELGTTLDAGTPDYALITQTMDKRYLDHIALEMDARFRIDEEYANLFAQQFGSREAADSWRTGVNEVRKLSTAAMVYYRTGDATMLEALGEIGAQTKNEIAAFMRGVPVSQLSQAERNAAWKMFTDKIYKPLIAKEMQTNQIKVGEMAVAAAKANPGTVVRTPEEIDAVKSPMGTVEKLMPEPIQEAEHEGWMMEVRPVLDEAQRKFLSHENDIPEGTFADAIKAGLKRNNPSMSEAEVDAALNDVTRQVRSWTGQVRNQMSSTRLAAVRWGEAQRDMALLNYQRRLGADNLLNAVFPYQFWYGRTMLNWAARAIDQPAMLANYGRLKNFQENTVNRPGFPTRLAGKMAITIPFLPDWMGEGIYIDPMKQIYPFEALLKPFEKLDQQKNIQAKKAMAIIQEMVGDEVLSPEAGQDAIDTMTGEVWEKAYAQAGSEIGKEIASPLDFLSLLASPSLPLQWALKFGTGKQNEIGQLPPTRLVQSVTGLLGIGGPAGINLEGGFRKSMGLPEVDQFYDYRVDRMLAGMAADGEIDASAAQQAMISRQGPEFEQAQRKVAQLGFWQYAGSPLGVDFFPEGEQEQRALRDQYQAALDESTKAGNWNAYNAFFDEHPEYEAQRAAWRDPEERLHRFLISEVWDRYMSYPDLQKKQIREQLGSVFTDSFVNKETRSYEAIDSETLAMWSRMMGGNSAGVNTPNVSLKLADKQTAAAVQSFYDERDRRFPNIGQINSLYYNLGDAQQQQFGQQYPQVREYSKWRTAYLADHPEIIGWVEGETSELKDLSAETQAYVYQYRALKDQLFPNISTLQEQYANLTDSGQKAAFNKAHPELSQYYDWRKQMAAQNTKASPYILSDDALSNAILGDQDLQAYMYNYRAQRDATFPQYVQQQNEYFDLPEGRARKAYLNEHPELSAYWSWRDQQAALYPKASPEILSDTSLSKKILGNNTSVLVATQITNQFSPDLMSELAHYYYGDQKLMQGAYGELHQQMKTLQYPGTVEQFLEDLRPAFGV